MRRDRLLSTRIASAIIPPLLASIVVMALLMHDGLSRTIPAGMENRLRVIGALNAAGIDAGQHDRLTAFRQETALAVDSARGKLYLAHALAPVIRRVDLASGRYDAWECTNVGAVVQLCWDEKRSVLHCAGGAGGNEMFTLDPATMARVRSGFLPGTCRGLAYRLDGDTLFALVGSRVLCSSAAVFSWQDRGAVRAVAPSGLAVVADCLAILDAHSSAIGIVNCDDLSPVRTLTVSATAAESDQPAFPFRGLARAGGKFFCGTPVRPVEISDPDGRVRALRFTGDPQDELRDAYARLSRILENVRAATGLTYLSTMILTNDLKTLVYVVDGITNELHSLCGYRDPTPLEDGIVAVWRTGRTFVSGAKKWADYGWIRSVYQPVFDGERRVRAMLAADVVVAEYLEKEDRVVLIAVVCGIASIVACILVALLVAWRIVVPVRRLKDFALRVAAGGYGETLPLSGAGEIRNLTAEFNRMSVSVGHTVAALTVGGAELERLRIERELRRLHARFAVAACADLSALTLQCDPARGAGSFRREELVVAWDGGCDEAGSAAVAVLVARLAEKDATPEKLVAALCAQFPSLIAVFGFVPGRGLVLWQCRDRDAAALLRSSSGTEPVHLSGGSGMLVVQPGEKILYGYRSALAFMMAGNDDNN